MESGCQGGFALVLLEAWVSDLWGWMDWLACNYGYAGAFMITVLGNISIFIPIPFAVVIYCLGATLNPLLLGLVTGLGSTIGEFSSYLVGRGGRALIEKRYGQRLESAKMLVQKYGMVAIFLFALLPLPDDLLMIPMGMLKYSLKKAFAAMLGGKVIMGLILAYAGHFSFTVIGDLFESSGIWGGIISIILLILVIVAIVRVDWTRFIKAHSDTKKAE